MGGGANGGNNSGTPNTGGGAGGQIGNLTATSRGGSGIVIVKYLLPTLPARSMTLTFSGYTAGKETLTNFPALVTLGTNLSGFAYSQFLGSYGGYDLRFMSGATELNYEIESWGATGNSNSYVWVQVPLLTNGTVITATWGDATKTQQAYTTNGATWTGGYVGVWHLPNGIALGTSDSTTNKATGTVNGGVSAAAGVIDGGALLNGSSGYVEMEPTYLSNTAIPFTLTSWINLAGFGKDVYPNIMRVKCGAGKSFVMALSSQPSYEGLLFGADSVWPQGKAGPAWASFNAWNHLAVTYNGAGATTLGNYGAYANSTSLTIGAAGMFSAYPNATTLGGTSANNWWDGLLDEVRISSVVRSTNWVWAEWFNMASNTAFQTYGAISGTSIDGGIPYYKNKLGYWNILK